MTCQTSDDFFTAPDTSVEGIITTSSVTIIGPAPSECPPLRTPRDATPLSGRWEPGEPAVADSVDGLIDPSAADTLRDRSCQPWVPLGGRRARSRANGPEPRENHAPGAFNPHHPYCRAVFPGPRSVCPRPLLMARMRELGADLCLPDSYGPVTLQHHLSNVVRALEELGVVMICGRRAYSEYLALPELYERIYRRIVIDRMPAPRAGETLVLDLGE